jgi:energy-coupling factor transporter ATP-binding protein EcfA2
MITKATFRHFTAFEDLVVDISPGINVFIGANATGKTHILKAIYSACAVTKTAGSFADKILRVFMPSGRKLGRLVHRRQGSSNAELAISRRLPGSSRATTLKVVFSNHASNPDSATVTGIGAWCREPIESVYIPVKEMPANAPGFHSLVASREAHFEEVYSDVVDRALLPLLKGPTDAARKRVLDHLRNAMEGKVETTNEEFFLRSRQGRLEFSLLAEGIRKLGLLWVLIQNGTLLQGSVLCWDEPEANLNPRLVRSIAEILLELSQAGVQILLATHDYVLLKELDLRAGEQDDLSFHSLWRGGRSGDIEIHSTTDYVDIHPNAIAETFDDLFDRDVDRALGAGVDR